MSNFEDRCWVEIDLATIRQNYMTCCSFLKPGQEIMAVVKADAYGHGEKEITRTLADCGCNRFAVSNIFEALSVRGIAPEAEILVLGYTPPRCINLVYDYGITQAVLSEEYARLLIRGGKRVKCQFAIDTGMNRIGLDGDYPEDCARIIKEYALDLDVIGIFTHLCVADSNTEEDCLFTERQIQKFKAVADAVKPLKLREIHCLNTAGGFWHNAYGNLVRLGISLYGLKPDYENVIPEGIQPALMWKSVVSMVKQVEKGEYVGYGRTFCAPERMTLATIPTGYADGYNRRLSNTGWVIINGTKAKIVGRICMDQMMADVSGIPNVCVGDVVTLIGQDGNETITADDIANMTGTIGYEVVCAISKRVSRKFIECRIVM